VFWLAAVFELLVEISAAMDACKSQEKGIETLKPSKMNRLQRSIVKGRVPAVGKDSTVNVSTFLANTLSTLNRYLQGYNEVGQEWKVERRTLTVLLRYWWDTYHLAASPQFEEATFQAHLAVGTSLLDRISSGNQQNVVVVALKKTLKTSFDSGFKLTTGLSMEIMWKYLRPIVISKPRVMETLFQMEQLARRFDSLRWKASISVKELGGVVTSLVKAYHLVLTSDVDAAALIKTLSEEMGKLEANMGSDEDGVTPYLENEFEGLRQFKALEGMRSERNQEVEVDVDVLVLANHPTTSDMRLKTSRNTSRSLQSIDYLWGHGGGLQPIMDSFSTGLLHKLNDIGEVDLMSLKLLEFELPIVGEKVALSSKVLCRDQLSDLNKVLAQLVVNVIAVHGASFGEQYHQWTELLARPYILEITEPGEPTPPSTEAGASLPHLQKIICGDFELSSHAMISSKRQPKHRMIFAAMAWIHFAIGCIKLYVPDRAFDPDKRQRLERQRHIKLWDDLNKKLYALSQFELTFSGQESNLRCRLLEEEISELGEPEVVLQQIYRPEVSELDQLQGEFGNLLQTIVGSDVLAKLLKSAINGVDSELQDIRLLQNNVGQIVRRLSERFRAYNDLTAPVISMLRCLEIGLSMAALAAQETSAKSGASQALARVAPFLGGTPAPAVEDIMFTHPMEYLELVATNAAVENLASFESQQRQSLLKAFHGCYDQWTKKLEADRAEAESKSGLYRFRGSAEDEEQVDQEQFNDLFPSYDNESTETRNDVSATNSARDTAVELSKMHGKIFLGGRTPHEGIEDLIRHTSKQIGRLHDTSANGSQRNMTGALLPGILLLLEDQIEALSPAAVVPESYNFYTDANLPESRKLVTLIHSIQARYRELQAVDEIAHMQPLADVLTTCRELLQFRHTEPLAKIITKVEQIHAFMHEWQFGGWASRANSALAEYDELTQTIVSWRRLELSTWGKLFDMETKKCEDDARSWWFVAYQVVVAAPLQMSESPDDLKSYAQKLLQDLESYFSTAIMGQFVQRLQLLKQLQKHLELVMLDVQSMSIIHGALSNFISLYVQYEKPVQEHLKKGRASLEKAMRDVLLLASWKDTNIVALRDSAKRSHHKLFKIVRKFREVLGQPMDGIVKQGIPDENIADAAEISSAPTQLPTVDQSALVLCAESVPSWKQKSKRFVNVSKTVSVMADASQIPGTAVEGSAYLDSFLTNIITSTAELQKATPSVLTEDNKDTVKHLKSRKRKLFADTLKDLRQMGIKYNLGTEALSKQESLSVVLANTEPLATMDISGLEYYFHKSIDLAPRAREAARQPNEDLSSAEVARSTGFLEGLLQTLLSQHSSLASCLTGMAKLETNIKMAKGLWAPNAYEIRATKTITTHAKLLRWLPNTLTVALDLIKIHSKLGKQDSQAIYDSIFSWRDTIAELAKEWDSLQKLPSGVATTEQQNLENSISDSTQQLRLHLAEMIEERPDLGFILNQILPWTEVTSSPTEEPQQQKTLEDLDQKLSTVWDAVLVAIEKHKKAISELPTSTDDLGWLVKNETSLSNAIKSLHCNSITEQLEQAFEILRGIKLEDPTTSKAAAAIFAVALPILQQYLNTLQESITRYGQLHRATCKTSYILAKTFTQIASQGYCTPSEKSDAQDGQNEKLEGGTGLGEGEGAEDISKDIQDDENLDELAQEPNTGEKGEMEDEQDAVDMADGEMEGEIGDGEEKGEDEKGSGDEEEGDEMDEEAGDVDDLDPTAVDERMWDGDGEQAEKDQEGDDSKGKQQKDELAAAQESDEQAETGDEGDEDEVGEGGAEQGEEIKQDQVEKHDPHAQEGEALDLPEDMELDGNEDEGSAEGSDDGMNDLSDVEEEGKEDEVANDGKEEEVAENADAQEDENPADEMDVVDLDEEEEHPGDKTEEAGEKVVDEEQHPDPENEEGFLRERNDEANADADNAVPSDVQGVGEDQDESSIDDRTESASKAQREDGGKGGDSSEQKDAAAEDGEKGRQAAGDAPQDARDETQDSAAAQPFKKLGDALESWHRQQTQIREPAEQREQGQDQNPDINAEASEFQHLQDEDAEADTQALGTATEEQAHAVDESMAVDSESKGMPEQFQPDEVEKDKVEHDDVVELEEESTPKEQDTSDAYEGRAGAMIKQAKEDRDEDRDDARAHRQEDLEEDVEEVDNQLDHTHLDDSTSLSLTSAAETRQQWTHYESLTRDLSLSLTEQLRLILAPTLATKMRGDFRTGKRLNIKRIIPYIASQYKRDKIWMRRSVPSKRSYQIMLAVDDSKSMGESGSGSLALETLVMISKSLSMLEVGEICVVGFGENVKVAHDFYTPFSSDAGPKVFQNFGFDQSRTDVTKLIRESVNLFRTARAKASSSPADLWQMQLIISDGVCDSSEHEPIRRLLREAVEERIMMVFVIVDDVKNKKKGESVLDLKEAKFVKDEITGRSEVKVVRYLDTFPFQYYLVVSDVKELPGVLATLLRQWFAEVVDSSS
jgi:midasin